VALLASGKVVAWGGNEDGQLGDGTDTGPETCTGLASPCSRTPVPVSNVSGAKAIAGGSRFGLALLRDGKVLAWGDGEHGQLGDGSTANRDEAVEVRGLPEEAIAIAAGANFGPSSC
jgi:alpha-tubulin suppressor-like RCC1 family protein